MIWHLCLFCLTVKDREKLSTAAEVILSSSISIISCSTNVDFRKACLESMKVGKDLKYSVVVANCIFSRKILNAHHFSFKNYYSYYFFFFLGG